jgi:hypothetical protein
MQLFLSRFVGFNMLIIAYFYYALLDTETAFKGVAIWNAVGVLFGPTYGLLYLDAIMTPDGMAGECQPQLSNLRPQNIVAPPCQLASLHPPFPFY